MEIKKKLRLDKKEVLDSVPLRNPKLSWRKNKKGEVVITLPRRSDQVGKILSFFFLLPRRKLLVLDEVGSLVFEKCDGKSSVRQIIGYLQRKYLLTYLEAQNSLTQYLKELALKGIIGLEVKKDGKK